MTSSGGVFSQTLQDITATKLQELSKKRAAFEELKAAAIARSDAQNDPIHMLRALSEGTEACFGIRRMPGGDSVYRGGQHPKLEADLGNLNRFIDQARFDPSISTQIVQRWRENLINHLEMKSLKYQYADLYGQLTVEWLSSSRSKGETTRPAEQSIDYSDDLDDFEEVSVKARLEARQMWERSVFEPDNVDSDAITRFLDDLFEGEEAQKALQSLRDGISDIENEFGQSIQFNNITLTWAIKGLLASELLTNEKRDVLRDFLSNPTILSELADVLNMRIHALDTWSWGSEVSVEARRSLNGKFRIHMHEDLLQAIFLQFIGSRWSAGLKEKLMDFGWNKELWNLFRKEYTPVDKQRRKWYLPPESSGGSLERTRALYYRGGYFVSQLLISENQDLTMEEGDEEANFSMFVEAAAVNTRDDVRDRRSAGQARFLKVDSVNSDEEDDDMGFGLFDNPISSPPDLTNYRPKDHMDARQRLLHL